MRYLWFGDQTWEENSNNGLTYTQKACIKIEGGDIFVTFSAIIKTVSPLDRELNFQMFEFNVVNSLVQGFGRTYKGTGLLLAMAHGSNFGRMTFLLPLMTHMHTARVEPRFAGCKSVAVTTKPRLHLTELHFQRNSCSTFPPHLKHVDTLPCEMQNSKCSKIRTKFNKKLSSRPRL